MTTAPVEFVIDLKTAKKKSLPPALRRRLGNAISRIADNRQNTAVPLGEFFDALREEQVTPIDVDGTEWSGFLCGMAEGGTEEAKNQRVSIQLVFQDERGAAGRVLASDFDQTEAPKLLAREALQISWCRIGSTNRVEVVAYLM